MTNISLQNFDPEIYNAIKQEKKRQEDHVELIASENYVSQAIMQAQGSVLTNKYAEGYPGARYYGGCEHVDRIERLAQERAKVLFQAEFVNVQAHSGSQANFAVYTALLKPGDTILAMDLNAGGHLTHGHKANLSGKLYNFVHYALDPKTEQINYEEVATLAEQHQPKLILAGFSAYSRIVDWKKFREIADISGAIFMVDMAHVAGLVASGHYPSPLPFADVVTSTTHKTLRGPRGGLILARQNSDLTKKINSAVFPGSQGGPLMHVIAGKAICFQEALEPGFKVYQTQVLTNAKAMEKVFHDRQYEIVSGGTDNHLMLIKLINKPLDRGNEAEKLLDSANITVNKNTIFNDPKPPGIGSGIRIGTPAITTRGLKEMEVIKIAHWICDILDKPDDLSQIALIKKQVIELLSAYAVPDGWM